MNKKLLILTLLCVSLTPCNIAPLFAGGYAISSSQTGNPLNQSSLVKIKPASSVLEKRGLLLFFLNPNGRPCRLQEQIINSNRAAIEKRFRIRPVMTTVQADRMFFYRFGVRRLPAIILLNNDGTVYHQLPPGIRSENQLMPIIEQYR